MKNFIEKTSFKLKDVAVFKQKAIYWANLFPTFCLLDSNIDKTYQYSSFDFCLAVDAVSVLEDSTFENLENFIKEKDAFGYFSYDLKNEIEELKSENTANLETPLLYFFEPRYLLKIVNQSIEINRNYPEAFYIFDYINNIQLPENHSNTKTALDLNVNKAEYLKNVEKIKNHIIEGDIYELNYCVEYFKENFNLEALELFNKINKKTASPFSSFLKFKDFFALSFSPERFLKKEGQKLISQPIKGTIRKSENAVENEALKTQLQNDIKERAENVMIVDLVRNDLTKSSVTGSIKVEELFKVYEFKTINQMISTVISTAKEDISNTEIIKNTFPMGSMTGAPKIRAMQIIESIEKQKRGLYSGSIGYFSANGNFDFNVVIRSLIYNTTKKYLSLQVGGAITYDSIPEKEWEETKTKVRAIIEEL